MSVSMLLNSDDAPGADRSGRRDRENGRIPINSLLSRSADPDLANVARTSSSRHHGHTATSSHRHDTLHRQSSMYTDRRATTSSARAPLPSFASLHQSFHYSDGSGGGMSGSADDTNSHRNASHSHSQYSQSQHQQHNPHPHALSHQHPHPPAYHPHNQHSSRRAAATSHTNPTATRTRDDAHATRFASGSGGKSLMRTKSVPYVSSPLSKNSSSAASNMLMGDSSGGGGGSPMVGVSEVPMSPASSSSSSHQGGGNGNGQQQQGVNPPRRRWKPWEDQLLIQLVSEQGPQRWNHIAQGFPGRNGRQVRLRWMNHLQPSLDKRLWRPEEDAILLEAHKELGNKWALIAMRLHGRTDNSVKNRYKSIARRAARTSGQPLDK